MKKLLAAAITAMMMTSLVGCAVQPAAPAAPAAPAGETAEAPQETEAPAEEGAKEVVNINIFTRGMDNTGEGITQVIDAMNEYSAEKIGVTVSFDTAPATEYRDTLARKIAAKDDIDVVFVANYTGYGDLAKKGGLMDLTSFINDPEYADLKAIMPENIWAASAINGAYYCVPNYKESATGMDMITPVALADTINEKYGIDFNALQIGSFRDYDKLTPYLEAARDEGITNPMYTNSSDSSVLSVILGDTTYERVTTDYTVPYVINYETGEVSNIFANEDFLPYFETMQKWYEAGIWKDDLYAATDTNWTEYLPLENYWGVYPENAVPDGANSYSVAVGQEVYSIVASPYVIKAAGATGSTWAITAYSQKAEACMNWIRLLETDTEFADLFIYGIEGVNYTRDENGVVTLIPDSGYKNARWKITNINTASIAATDSPDIKDRYAKFNESGMLSPYATFSADLSPIESEIAAAAAIYAEEQRAYTFGLYGVDNLSDTMAKYQAAGDEAIIAELQRQVDEYLGK